MKPLNDLDEQMKNEESTKLNFITPAIQKKWNAEGDRIVMEYGKKGSGHYFTDGQILVGADGTRWQPSLMSIWQGCMKSSFWNTITSIIHI